jgi:hypothetical protein
MMRKFAILVAASSMAGCATSGSMSRVNSYAMPVHHVKMDDDAYRVYDHKTDKSLMVSPSLGKVMSIGAAEGATLGLADTMTPEKLLEAAAQKRLDETGRGNCKITKGYMLQKPLYEFWYECG